MTDTAGSLSADEAAREIRLVSRRLGLLHLAFAEALVAELGEVEGRRLIVKAIENYGRKIGERKKAAARARGLEPTREAFGQTRDLPGLGMHDGREAVEVDGEPRTRAYGCAMAEVWKEYGREDLGRLYCLVDPVNAMTFNPAFKLVSVKALPEGDPHCELTLRPTSEEERRAFQDGTLDWEALQRGA